MSKKYKSRNDHDFIETVRSLPTMQKKLDYIWEYYKMPILVAAFIIFFAVTMGISIYNNSAPVYLHGDFVNVLPASFADDAPRDYLADAFLHEYLQLPEDDRTRMTYTSDLILNLDSTSVDAANNNYYTLNQIDAHIAAQEVDYFLLTDTVIGMFDVRYEALLDLRKFLTAEELALYQDRLRYTATGIPVAIDISDSGMVMNMGLVGDGPICLAWCSYVRNPEHMRPFFDFIMGTIAE